MIAPNRHVCDRGNFGAGFVRQLRFCAIFVEPRHRKPTIAWDRLRVIHRDQAIRITGISNYEDAHVRPPHALPSPIKIPVPHFIPAIEGHPFCPARSERY
jgi:hypothetical protein